MGKSDLLHFLQSLTIQHCNLPSVFDPLGGMTEFYIQHSSLHIVEEGGISGIVKFTGMAVFAIISQQGRDTGYFRVVSRKCATVSKSTQGLKWIKAETADSE